MFSDNVGRNSLSNVDDGKPLDNSVEPQVLDKTQNQPDTHLNEDERKLANKNAAGLWDKYMKFELEDENDTNGCGLCSGIVLYLDEYMSIHVSE